MRRIHAELTIGMGIEVGSGQVHTIMKHIGVQGISGTRKRYISKQDVATDEDLVNRNFTATRENQLWCTDITEHPTPWIPAVVATVRITRPPVKQLGAQWVSASRGICGGGR
ncbi:hypothetical protein [Nocardia lijiangensis]|uniref:hypothetical protein n=1 Tax=Nocardia lijiangensis TaxID=299618 RepID=UPI003D7209DA